MRTTTFVAAVAALTFSTVASAGGNVIHFTGAGPIPDGPTVAVPIYGAPLVMTATVADPDVIERITLSITMSHGRVGDLNVQLNFQPAGSSSVTSCQILDRLGAPTPSSPGAGSNLNGTYVFTASADPIWDAALAIGSSSVVPGGLYQGHTNTLNGFSLGRDLEACFPNATAAGTWTLVFKDAFNLEAGSVQSASLLIIARPPQCITDINGDGPVDTTDLILFLSRFGQTCTP